VAVEKLEISEIRGNFGDRNYLAESRTSFVGHRNAIRFSADFSQVSFSTATPDFDSYEFTTSYQ
jgi:hypothetical protein